MEAIERLIAELRQRLAGCRDANPRGFDEALEGLAGDLRELVNSTLRQLSPLDPITSVLNAAALREAADTEAGRSRRYHHPWSVLALGVDGYSEILEAYGSDGASTLLRTLILDCCRGIRACDVVGRTDEADFALVLPETGLEGAVHVAQRLRGILRETPAPVGEAAVSYTVSLGVAAVTPEDASSASVLARATEALRRARDGAPDRTLVARPVSLDGDDLEDEFHRALGAVTWEYVEQT